jgi:hypothetical protein
MLAARMPIAMGQRHRPLAWAIAVGAPSRLLYAYHFLRFAVLSKTLYYKLSKVLLVVALLQSVFGSILQHLCQEIMNCSHRLPFGEL